jgi:hypothetical protein
MSQPLSSRATISAEPLGLTNGWSIETAASLAGVLLAVWTKDTAVDNDPGEAAAGARALHIPHRSRMTSRNDGWRPRLIGKQSSRRMKSPGGFALWARVSGTGRR